MTGAGNYERLLGGRVVVFLLRVATLIKKEMAEKDELMDCNLSVVIKYTLYHDSHH